MTDFRALCAELVEYLALLDEPPGEFVVRAQGALAEPQPAADGEVAELVRKLGSMAADAEAADFVSDVAVLDLAIKHLERLSATGKPGLQDGPAVQSREPASVTTEPSDQQLLDLAAKAIHPYETYGIAVGEYEAELGGAVEVYSSELIAYARAVLARWGTTNLAKTRSLLEPIPVSERLPEAGDCNEAGRCWWLHIGEDGLGDWFQRAPYPSATSYTFFRMTHWLPCHALPLPKEVE